jgi:hypothetical protein
VASWGKTEFGRGNIAPQSKNIKAADFADAADENRLISGISICVIREIRGLKSASVFNQGRSCNLVLHFRHAPRHALAATARIHVKSIW